MKQWQNTAKLLRESSSLRNPHPMPRQSPPDLATLRESIRQWGLALGFQKVGFADIELHHSEQRLLRWLEAGHQGDMNYMSSHGTRRTRPAELVPGTISVISARMDYLPETVAAAQSVLENTELAYVSRYALGRDYHKLMRKRLQKLAAMIESHTGPFGYRVFVDSAPVMEKPLANKAGLGWMGKHTNLIDRKDGSFFFIGEVYTDLPLTPDRPTDGHCGTCSACIDVCPTAAIIAPYRLDARRCISYLTIEHHGSIPEELRPAIGNRIYGCDDCQLVCPWNRFAKRSSELDFLSTRGLESARLVDLFRWTERKFLDEFEGSPIRRLGFERWMRNIAVALGNAPSSPSVLQALREGAEYESPLVREHSLWGLRQHEIGNQRCPDVGDKNEWRRKHADDINPEHA